MPTRTKRSPKTTPDPFTSHPRARLALDGPNACPIGIADARDKDHAIFSLMSVRYTTTDGKSYAETWPAGKAPENGQLFEHVSTQRTREKGQTVVRVKTRSPHFLVTKEFAISPRQPWVHVRYTIKATGQPMKALQTQIMVPAIEYAPDLENPLDADFVTFSFGRILPGGFESPPWLSFWHKGRKTGAIVWTPTREAMRRIFPRDALLAGVHPKQSNASSDTTNDEWNQTDFAKPYTWEFYLWPIRSSEWKSAAKKLAGMKFKSWDERKIAFHDGVVKPRPSVAVFAPSKSNTKKTATNGRGFTGSQWIGADEIARANRGAASRDATMKRWWHVRGPRGRSLLYAQDPLGTRPLRIPTKARGRHRVKLVLNGGSGIQFRTSDMPSPLRFLHEVDIASGPKFTGGVSGASPGHPFYNALLLHVKQPELDAGEWNLNGKSLEVRPSAAMYDQTILAGVRLEPVVDVPAVHTSSGARGRAKDLYGVSDTPDVAGFDATPSKAPYHDNAAEHPRAGFDIVYWRADGQCCDYHTKVGTVRYPVLRTHSVFNPQTLPYGLALRKDDLLTAAVKAVHTQRGKIFGYMRLNGFAGNVTPRFFIDHPELRDEREVGPRGSRMPYYLPEFRKWKVDITREIVQHQVDGLLLDLTRSPPMNEYHPDIVRAYEQKYGEPPPRNMKRGYVSYGIHPLETGEEWIRWWKFRADGFTQFGRDIRQMLKEEGKADLPIHVQVRPKMALFDGLNIGQWLDEGLMKTLNVWPTDFDTPDEIFQAVNGRVPVRCTISCAGGELGDTHEREMWKVLEDSRFGGLTIYESDHAVWSPRWRRVMREMKGM